GGFRGRRVHGAGVARGRTAGGGAPAGRGVRLARRGARFPGRARRRRAGAPMTFVALGDSITWGMGDPVPGGWRGWAALLAGALDVPLHNLAVPGALTTDVEREQLPRALELRPSLAAVVAGVNDTLRRGFDAGRVGAALAHTVGALSAAGATVLTMRLPDPGRTFGLPGALARPLGRRIRAVNAVADAVAARYGTVHFDAAGHPLAYDRRMWSVGRLHPSERGH